MTQTQYLSNKKTVSSLQIPAH